MSTPEYRPEDNPFRNTRFVGKSGGQRQSPVPQPASQQQPEPSYQQLPTAPGGKPKSKAIAVLLAVFFGDLGVHNFYLGNTRRGIGQLVMFFGGLSSIAIGVGFFTLFFLALWVFAEIVLIVAGSGDYATS